MATVQQLSNLLPFEPFQPNQLAETPQVVPYIPLDELQLATDMINVMEGRVPLTSFPAEYQKKILFFYQFSATRYYTQHTIIAKMTPDTFDII